MLLYRFTYNMSLHTYISIYNKKGANVLLTVNTRYFVKFNWMIFFKYLYLRHFDSLQNDFIIFFFFGRKKTIFVYYFYRYHYKSISLFLMITYIIFSFSSASEQNIFLRNLMREIECIRQKLYFGIWNQKMVSTKFRKKKYYFFYNHFVLQ